jgi:tRNA threonylcarbamoyladenosine biosynthesis protein TsaB
MHLHIDTSDPNQITIKLDDQEFAAESRVYKTQYLLEFIDASLRNIDKSIEDIKNITINKGPGSFTGLRVGATVASTLGWALDIPVDITLQLV